jgi:hypothetical protein
VSESERLASLRAPFPWFGGKSRAAGLIWPRFGRVPNYVEPFAGSLAVLLARPHAPDTETVNDADAYLANFWRAVKADPDSVAGHADWPVNEADLHARHAWLLSQHGFRERMLTDPDFYDVQIAGWWLWGVCSWIGDGWCVAKASQLPHLGTGKGVHRRKLPHLGDKGMGIHRRGGAIAEWMTALSDRLRLVRVACGDWTRVLSESVTTVHVPTAVLLDPPYAEDGHYVEYPGGGGVAADVAEWARENGGNPLFRIALCGYRGTFEPPPGWTAVAWKTKGGYGSQGNGRGRANATRETIWFSPGCLRCAQEVLTL